MPAFSHPLWLLVTPFVIYLLWRIERDSFAEGSRVRRRFWFFLRSVILLLLIGALAGFQFRTKTNQKQILFLLDVSDSIPPEQRERAIRFINESMKRIHAPDQAGVIAFAANAQVERFPTTPHPLVNVESTVNGTNTNLESGVHLAEALFAANYQKNLVVLSDGLETTGNAAEAFREIQKKGISTQAFYLPPSERPEAGLESFRIPDEIGLKKPFHLEVVASSNRRTPALLQILRNGVLLQEGTILLQKDHKQLIRIPQKIPSAGIYRYEVQLKPAEDSRIENNSSEAWISVQGLPRVLLVDDKAEDLRTVSDVLQKRGFEVDLRPTEQFPFSLQEMLTYQAIWIRNVPASRIHKQMQMLQQYVSDFGGGFAMLGGEKSFGPGGYYQTPVEIILPVRMDLVNKKYLADVAMVIVIDKSGSMSFADRGRQKIDLADEGGARVASLLKKTDQLGVLAVDSVPKWAYPLKKLANRDEAIDAITSIRAGGGGIYVYSGLREAYQELRSIRSSVKHVILFADTADCEEKEGPYGDSSLALAQKAMRDDRITTTAIGIGQPGDIDVEFLRQLATIGEGRFYFTNDMYTLPEIFTQESAIVQRYYITEERFTPRFAETEPLLAGIGSVPDLLGYVATSAKTNSRMALLSHREDPLLAFWRYGFGQTVAFTSDPTSRWGTPWLSWPDYGRFWAQVARYLAQENPPARFRTSFTQKDNTTIVVEALDERGDFLNNADFQAILIDRAGKEFSVRLSQTAPGRYEGNIPATGNLFGKIYRFEEGTVREASVVRFSGENLREFAPQSGGRQHLEELTGKVVDSPQQLRFAAQASEDIHPLRDSLLLWASFLFLLDVAARKLDFRQFRPAAQRVATEPSPVPSPLTVLKDRKRMTHPKRISLSEIPVEIMEDVPRVKSSEEEIHGPESPEEGNYLERLKAAKKRKPL